MKIINLIWRSPDGSIVREKLNAAEFKIHTDGPFVKLNRVNEGGGVVRILPVQKIELIEFGEEKEESPLILPPTGPMAIPRDPS